MAGFKVAKLNGTWEAKFLKWGNYNSELTKCPDISPGSCWLTFERWDKKEKERGWDARKRERKVEEGRKVKM